MHTFEDFLTEKTLAKRIEETAALMVQKNVDPVLFLQEWYEKNHPEASVILEGLWDNLKAAGSQTWQGVKQGANQFAANQWGPQAKFNQAINSLTSLVQYMQNDPALQNMKGNTGPLINQIANINKQLTGLRDYIPQMQSKTTGQWEQPNKPANSWEQGMQNMDRQKVQQQQQQPQNSWQQGMQNMAAQQPGSPQNPIAAQSVPEPPPLPRRAWKPNIKQPRA
ncbi:MAG: hypothetical protein DWQ19_12060 [Crenarchaeota archaeon]|nr:MAG: hypothetical protein DWQ19_12060 [Thermoproteota archaeon]